MDPEHAAAAVAEFLPDFIAWAENPNHPDAQRLYARGVKQVSDSYLQSMDSDADAREKYETQMVAMETALAVGACAEWIVEDRRNREQINRDERES